MIDITCPFCGNQLRFLSRWDRYDEITTEVECRCCEVEFRHTQRFYLTSDNDRIPVNKSFEEIFGGKQNEN